ncbi:ferrous iron transport protein B [Clostridium amylolyticum]|uniref:Ferrous iron transport protein B n=1 Tax=Clostridium amylolyticum TaxID=1121298 RepID=A0A1M6PDR2_9CLOT|nr:ferrous iron transport protein B [Clostridium amylolyticum]SHK06093.1 ferrous iron transport protein B [Clostridium amylolyticum]
MGFTYESTKKEFLKDNFNIEKKDSEFIIALAGNPNTGKSTVFNSLTGLHQHTGNWPGKTVVNARGEFSYKDKSYVLVDLPGTYSLFATSVEEVVARDYLCFGNPEAVIVVTDATALERNLNLVFQVMELTSKVILCVNLIDEAAKKKITVDGEKLSKELGIPVVLTAARNNVGMEYLKDTLSGLIEGRISSYPNNTVYSEEIEEYLRKINEVIRETMDEVNPRWYALRMLDGDESLYDSMKKYLVDKEIESIKDKINNIINNFDKNYIRDEICQANFKRAEEIKEKVVKQEKTHKLKEKDIDDILTSKRYGLPIMILLLAVVLWLTVTGANYPSELIARFLFGIEAKLTQLFNSLNAPAWLHGIVVLGLYRTLAWVVSVMLPPMAIFFPIFTLLEDLGYLPRVAFNMDHYFKKACAHGKQCLSMCMGLGCNAAGVIGCRIIDSPRERLIAILTNNFVPCNGRFPTLIAIASVFFVVKSRDSLSGILPALMVTAMVILGILVTLGVSFLLSKTILKGIPSSFTLELPPYRKPQVVRILYTSLIDRTVFVLTRAVLVAAPAGAITWILGNIYIGDYSIVTWAANFLEPFARALGLDGYILMAFILGFPANEIVLPILLMSYLSTGHMIEFESIDNLRQILLEHGWTYLTALNVMLFSLLHWPCGTTLWTIKKETGSMKWTIIGAVIPTIIAIMVCFLTTTIYRLFIA